MDNHHGESEDDLEITITDLPPEETRHSPNTLVALVLSRRRRLFTFTCIIFLIGLVFLPLTPSLYITPSRPQTRQINKSFISSNPTAVVGGAAIMWNAGARGNIVPNSDGEVIMVPGPLPQNCPADLITSKSHEVGQFPLKILGFSGSSAIVHLQNISLFHLHYWRGWAITLQLQNASDNTTPVTLTPGNLHKGPAPIFAFGPNTVSSLALRLDPQHPSNTMGQVAMDNNNRGRWYTRLYIPAAGCYFLAVSWPQGHWQITFAAGQ